MKTPISHCVAASCLAFILAITLCASASAASPGNATAKQPGQTAPATPDLLPADVESSLRKLGYTPTPAGAYTNIESQGYVVQIILSTDKMTLYMGITYGVSKDKQAKIPFQDLLVFNDIHKHYFSLALGDDMLVTLNSQMPIAGITQDVLRQELTDFVSDANDTQDMFNPARYK
jgi:hypothetical protein